MGPSKYPKGNVYCNRDTILIPNQPAARRAASRRFRLPPKQAYTARPKRTNTEAATTNKAKGPFPPLELALLSAKIASLDDTRDGKHPRVRKQRRARGPPKPDEDLAGKERDALLEVAMFLVDTDTDPSHGLAGALVAGQDDKLALFLAIHQGHPDENTEALDKCVGLLRRSFGTANDIPSKLAKIAKERQDAGSSGTSGTSSTSTSSTSSEETDYTVSDSRDEILADIVDNCSGKIRSLFGPVSQAKDGSAFSVALSRNLRRLADDLRPLAYDETGIFVPREAICPDEVQLQMDVVDALAQLADDIDRSLQPMEKVKKPNRCFESAIEHVFQFDSRHGPSLCEFLVPSKTNRRPRHESPSSTTDSLLGRLQGLAWYMRSANFLCNLARRLANAAPLRRNWFGDVAVHKVVLPESAFAPLLRSKTAPKHLVSDEEYSTAAKSCASSWFKAECLARATGHGGHRLPMVHAEVQVACHLLSTGHYGGQNPHCQSPLYIASSRKTCYLCHVLLSQLDRQFRVPETHQRLCPAWRVPVLSALCLGLDSSAILRVSLIMFRGVLAGELQRLQAQRVARAVAARKAMTEKLKDQSVVKVNSPDKQKAEGVPQDEQMHPSLATGLGSYYLNP